MPRKSAAAPSRGDSFPVKAFATAEAWRKWLEKNHARSPGLWVRIARKGSAIESVTSPELLDVALCYGWIDGKAQSESETTWLVRYTPRAKRSMWSERNREKARALIANGKMRPAGLRQIEAAKADGRWAGAYASPRNATVPPDLKKALAKSPAARKLFETLSASNRYAILWRIQTAKKPETRARRIGMFVEMLEKGETFH